MKIAAIGGEGLIGSRVVELLGEKHAFTSFSRSNGVDITSPETLTLLKNGNFDVVILLAAKTDVDMCDLDKPLGEAGEAWKINVLGAKNVSDFCRDNKIKMVFVSTDFVFDGKKPEGELYTEDDLPNPISWYGKTKYQGEVAVRESGADYLILRIAYPYRADFAKKKDFVRAIMGRLSQGLPVKGITDHVFTPTLIDDFAYALRALLEKNETGVFHVVGSQQLTPYDATILIAKTFGYDEGLVGKTTREEYFSGKAPRPFNLGLKNDRINKLGVTMQGFADGLQVIYNQLSIQNKV